MRNWVSLVLLFAGGTVLQAQTVQPVPFVESFTDANLAARGWYDGTVPIDVSANSPAGGGAMIGDYGVGDARPGGSMRLLFTPVDAVVLEYWVRYSPNWVGSGLATGPLEFMLVTTESSAFVGPGSTALTTLVAHTVTAGIGIPMIRAQDGANIDGTNLGVDLSGITENRALHGCNGPNTLVSPLTGTRQLVSDCVSTFNSTYWSTSAGVSITDGQWHYITAEFHLNTINQGIGQYDGSILYKVDGQVLIDQRELMLRTGQYPAMQFNQLLFLPFMGGSGSPIAQTMWIDELSVSEAMSVLPPSPPPLPPYAGVADVEQVLDSLRIRVRVGTPWDGISVVDSIVVSHRTNEINLVQFATGSPESTLLFQIPAPPTGVVYSGSYTATAFRDCATVANCTSVATSPPWRFAGQGPLPPEDLATWSNPEPPVLYNEPLAIDMVPASVSDCSSIGMRYWTRPAGTVGVMDTMRIHIITPGADGCTFFVPRNSATASLFFRTYFDDFMATPSGDSQIPSSPVIISTDTLSP